MEHAAISKGNTKIGKLPNVSLAPCSGCAKDVPCRKDCYAMKAFRMYDDTRKAWTRNLKMAKTNRDGFFSDIVDYLIRRNTEFFRWHVSGDIQDQNYLEGMKQIAVFFPEIKFLAFTKMHGLDFADLPENLTVIFSMWPAWGDTDKQMSRAWMQDGTEDRIPNSALHCPGACENCMMCWNLPEIKRDVYFTKH